MVADFASLAGVRGLAEQVRLDFPQGIDVLINNAGVYEQSLEKSQDGLELTWAVNVAAPFLLTSLLLGAVRRRVVNVASVSAASSIDFDNLQQERGYSAHGAYSLSKLADILFTYEVADRLKTAGSPVTCNCLDPGTVNTKMLLAGWGPIGMHIQPLAAPRGTGAAQPFHAAVVCCTASATGSKDANDEYHVATDPALDAVSSAYFVGSRQARSPAVSYDKAVQRRLWGVLEEQTGARWDA
ncbi:short chain dehydrogenase reductase family isoform B [Micractinium conductrix]|uniref:Short chain dehydrogenase reductase family isoform B n=1 Tax=Micractinium conductrix TaxID=554055 RepID=A0A2P6VLS5_9CHLO|nr:short chain dehydrogenase reductase family isoform B [Micractinium conductrix]|eukprot:PSC75038.1 short chain dehydrogenase reductase family isoform B [Micractinium conductrix]